MSLRSSSRSRKGQPGKVTKKPEEEIDLVDDEEDEPSENGVGSEDDVIELPEGTVVVNPEPVDDSDSSKPKSAKKRQKGSSMSMSVELNKLMSRILCTACGKQINPNNTGAVRRHPWLKVITCKKCYKFLKSGPIQKDKDGLDEQCRWCGEGGRLYGCDYCHNSFCRPCVKRNLGRSEAAKLEESTGKWKCYVCKPYVLKELVENCNKVMEVISKEEEKERLREERAREREREAAKKKTESKGKEQEEEKEKDEDKKRGSKAGTPTRTSLRAPVPKPTVPIVIKDDKVKSKDSEPIVIPDSSSEKSSSSNSNQGKKEPVVVVVGPKAKQPVTMPYAGKTVPMPRTNDVAAVRVMNFNHNLSKTQQNNNSNRGSLLLSAIQQPVAGNAYTRGLNVKPHINDLYALSQSIFPYNVDISVDKLIAATQALSLTLNGIKTDIAIAKLTSENMFNARQSGANSLKSGLHVFLNSIREIFNVQIRAVANSYTADPSLIVNGKAGGTDIKSSTPFKTEGKTESLDVSDIPILVDDSPMKKSASEPVIIDNKPDGSEDSATKDDSCIVVSQNDDDKSENESNSDNNSDSMDVDGEVVGKLKKVNESSQKIAEQYEKLKEKVTQAGGEDSENIAAQLELLKEMADELTQELDESEKEENDDDDDDNEDDDDDDDSDDDDELEDLDDDEDVDDEAEQEEKTEEIVERKTRSQIIQESAKSAGGAEKKDSEESSQFESPKLLLRKSREARFPENSSVQNKENEKDKKSVEQDKDKDKKDSPKKEMDDSSEKSPSKSKSDKSPVKPASRSSRSSSKREESIDSKEDSVTSESRTSRSKSRKDESDIADKDSKSVSNKSKSESVDGTEIEEDGQKSEKKVTKSKKDQEKDKKGKAKAAVTEIVTDEESTGEEGNLEEGEDENLDADSDDSEGIEIDETTRKKKSTRAKKSSGSAGKKGKGKDDKTVKGNKSKTSTKKDNDTEEEYKSDSSNFDPELEKQIKGVEKTLADGGKAKKKKKGKEEVESDSAEKKGKKEGKGKKKGGKSKGAGSDEELSSGTEEENVEEEQEPEEEEDDEDNLSPAQLRKLRAAREAAREKEEEEEGEVNMEDNSVVSSDPEVSFPKIQSPTKKGQKKAAEEMSEDSDFEPTKKKKRLRSSLLDAKLSESDSEVEKPKKGKGKKGGKRKRKESSSEEEEEEESEEEDEDTEDYSEDDKKKKKKGKGKKGKKGKGKKRRRIKKMSSSDEEGVEREPGEDDQLSGSSDEDDEGQGGYLKRKKIRKVMKNKKLTSETKRAQKAEEERRKRIEERQKEFNSYVEVEGGESEDEVPEGVEREKGDEKDKSEDGDTISKILGSPRKVPVTTKLILEMDKEKKKPLIEVERTLIRKLKPHQVDAVRFIYNCTIESIDRLKKEEGSGAIVAHCMGLGKTLSVITFVHTMLRNVKQTKMSKCLVVCPLNTVLNWVNEFEIWLDDVDFEIEVYELSQVKMNSERANMLKDWHSGGAGVMILGYDMYRNLVTGSHCKNKKQKAVFLETLADPGPDLVICDEGHILKNDATSISKSMNKIKTRRRIVLTGTPLQNNLGEYHCMVNFVKPNLLGTRKEFGNRFVNPITNGQCTDSSQADVRLMKRRAHILHEMLAGCVQRKDYSALTKFLPPKFEYVISVRLAPVQMELYQKYLDLGNIATNIIGKGARLFKDYQALMRIWTHPWVLKLDEIRQINKPHYDSEDSFIDDEGETDVDSFISDGSSSSSEAEVSPVDLDSDSSEKSKKKDKGKGKSTRNTRSTRSSRKKSVSSDEDSDKPKEKEEVVRKWTSRRRGNEEGAGASWMDIGVPENEYVNKEVSSEWWAEYVKEEDKFKMELSGKLVLLFEILKMCEDIGDKVLVFSQSLLSLDIIEDFLHHIDEVNQAETEEKKDEETKEGDKKDDKKEGAKKGGKKEDKKEEKKEGAEGSKDEAGGSGDAPAEKKEDKFAAYGKNWTRGADYFRMDGSTNAQNRKASQAMFNDEENFRARLFLISTKAGSLGINLVAANRVIIFDASWNPSHDIQSIFRVYRFGQVKPVYVYRFLAQGTMEEKIYERQVTKQSLSQRVVDEHQIERHFTSADLAELYKFTPDKLDDPNRKEQLPMLPKDHMLAELMTNHKEWIVTFHEHDSLLENVVEQELTDEEKKAAWEDYEEEKKGLRVNPMINYYQGNMNMNMGMQGMMNPNMFQNLLMQGQHSLGPNGVLRIVQDLKNRFPNLPPDMFQQRVQAVLRQILTQQIMQQSEIQRRQLDQQQMTELNRLHQIKQQIQRQQQILAQQRTGLTPSMSTPNLMAARGSSSNLSGATNQNQR